MVYTRLPVYPLVAKNVPTVACPQELASAEVELFYIPRPQLGYDRLSDCTHDCIYFFFTQAVTYRDTVFMNSQKFLVVHDRSPD